jgi:hypothetical protein
MPDVDVREWRELLDHHYLCFVAERCKGSELLDVQLNAARRCRRELIPRRVAPELDFNERVSPYGSHVVGGSASVESLGVDDPDVDSELSLDRCRRKDPTRERDLLVQPLRRQVPGQHP